MSNDQGILPVLAPQVFLKEHNGLVGFYIDSTEQPLETPPYALPSHLEAVLNMLAVITPQDKTKGSFVCPFDPNQILSHKFLQPFQKFLVFL